jgi:hypothetical protein
MSMLIATRRAHRTINLSRGSHAGRETNRTPSTQRVILTVIKSIYSTKNMNLRWKGIQTSLESLLEDPKMLQDLVHSDMSREGP